MSRTITSEGLRSLSMHSFERTDDIRKDILRYAKSLGYTKQKTEELLHQLGLRLALDDPMTVHRITNSVCKKVSLVKIETLPNEYPVFLKTPFLIEAKPGEYLIDDIHAIGGYIDNEGLFFYLAYNDNGCLVCHEKNPFSNNKLIADVVFINEDEPEQAKAYENKKRNILRFITILALMLEAEKSPVMIDSGNKKSIKRNLKENRKKNLADWIERRIYIDANLIQSKKNTERVVMDKEDKFLKDVAIQGFLRRQRYGTNNELMKWIYIDDFDSSRWTNKSNKRITVDTYFE